MKCANCRNELKRIATKKGIYFSCTSCGARMVTIPVLKRESIDPAVLNQIRSNKQNAPTDFTKRCPQCNTAMKQLSINIDCKLIILEICDKCFSVWFDKNEHDHLPITEATEKFEPKMHPDSLKALARFKIEMMNNQRRDFERNESQESTITDILLGVLGLFLR